MRAGAATFFYFKLEDVRWVQWRGRWAQARQLELYIQEVACISVLRDLSNKQRGIFNTFAKHAAALVEDVIIKFESC